MTRSRTRCPRGGSALRGPKRHSGARAVGRVCPPMLRLARVVAAALRDRGGMRIHLDTDLGGDTDDVCALAMLLGWPGVELVGVTSTIDPQGLRAGYLQYCLELAGRADVPVAAGAAASMTTRKRADPIVADERYWPA